MNQWKDDSLRDEEYPDEADTSDDDGATETVECSKCGREMAEGSPRCPHCGEWGAADEISSGGGVRQAAWIVIVMVLIGVILVAWHGLGR